jgi:myosin heavy subunit
MSHQELSYWTPEESCQVILHSIRSSCLNFSFQETPYSMYVTVRKSFSKASKPETKGSPEGFFSPPRKSVSDKQGILESKIQKLESANRSLTLSYENSTLELEAATDEKRILEMKIENLNDKLCDYENNVDTIIKNQTQAITSEKRSLQVKHELLSSELKDAKNESNELRKQVNNLNTALKSSKKENSEVTSKFTKNIDVLETKVKDLSDFKADKISEEKDLRNKIKKVTKKLKALADKEASLKIKTEALKKIDKNENNIVPEVDKHGKSVSQTITRQPYPPPHGPLTKTQYDLNQTLLVNEAVAKVETFTQIVKNFFKYKAGEDIDITISKLQAFNELFEPNIEKAEFDELVSLARETTAIQYYFANHEEINTDDENYDENYLDLPHHYLGDDGELVFDL